MQSRLDHFQFFLKDFYGFKEFISYNAPFKYSASLGFGFESAILLPMIPPSLHHVLVNAPFSILKENKNTTH